MDIALRMFGVGMGRFFGAARALLRESPNLGAILFSYAVSAFNAGLLVPVMPLFLMDRGFSLLQLGGLYSLLAVSTIGVQLVAARYQNVFGRRGAIIFLLLMSVVAFPTYLLIQTPIQYLLVVALTSWSSAAAGPGLQVLMAQVSPRNLRATVYSYFGLVFSFCYGAALVTAGILLAFGFSAVFFVGTLVSLLSFVLLLRFHFIERLQRPQPVAVERLAPADRALHVEFLRLRNDLQGIAIALGRARARLERSLPAPPQARRNVQWASLYLFLFWASLSIYPVFFPWFLAERGLPLHWVGLVIAASWISYGLCQPLGARYADRTGNHRALIVGSLWCAALLNLAMATLSLVWIVVAWVLLGIADGIGRPVTSAVIANSVPESRRSMAFGWTQAATTSAGIAAPYAFAFLIQTHGFEAGLLLTSLLVALAAIPLFFVHALGTDNEVRTASQPAPGAIT